MFLPAAGAAELPLFLHGIRPTEVSDLAAPVSLQRLLLEIGSGSGAVTVDYLHL